MEDELKSINLAGINFPNRYNQTIMDNQYDQLKRLFENLKTIGFWGRIFRWKYIKNMVIDAAADLQRLQMNNETLLAENTKLGNANSSLVKDLNLANEEALRKDILSGQQILHLKTLEGDHSDIKEKLLIAETDLSGKDDRIKELTNDSKLLKEKNDELSKKNTEYSVAEESRKQAHFTHTLSLDKIQERIQAEREKEIEEKHQS